MYNTKNRFNQNRRLLPEVSLISNAVNPSPNEIQILIEPSPIETLRNPILISSPTFSTPVNPISSANEISILSPISNVSLTSSNPTAISNPTRTSIENEPFSFQVGLNVMTLLKTTTVCDVACRPRYRFRRWRFATCCRRSHLMRTPWPWKQFFFFVLKKGRLLRVASVFASRASFRVSIRLCFFSFCRLRRRRHPSSCYDVMKT